MEQPIITVSQAPLETGVAAILSETQFVDLSRFEHLVYYLIQHEARLVITNSDQFACPCNHTGQYTPQQHCVVLKKDQAKIYWKDWWNTKVLVFEKRLIQMNDIAQQPLLETIVFFKKPDQQIRDQLNRFTVIVLQNRPYDYLRLVNGQIAFIVNCKLDEPLIQFISVIHCDLVLLDMQQEPNMVEQLQQRFKGGVSYTCNGIASLMRKQTKLRLKIEEARQYPLKATCRVQLLQLLLQAQLDKLTSTITSQQHGGDVQDTSRILKTYTDNIKPRPVRRHRPTAGDLIARARQRAAVQKNLISEQQQVAQKLQNQLQVLINQLESKRAGLGMIQQKLEDVEDMKQIRGARAQVEAILKDCNKQIDENAAEVNIVRDKLEAHKNDEEEEIIPELPRIQPGYHLLEPFDDNLGDLF